MVFLEEGDRGPRSRGSSSCEFCGGYLDVVGRIRGGSRRCSFEMSVLFEEVLGGRLGRCEGVALTS